MPSLGPVCARPFFPSPGLAGQRSRAWPAPARADGRWGEDGHEAAGADVARALVMAKRRTAGCPRVGVVPATAVSLTSCSYGLTHAGDRPRPRYGLPRPHLVQEGIANVLVR